MASFRGSKCVGVKYPTAGGCWMPISTGAHSGGLCGIVVPIDVGMGCGVDGTSGKSFWVICARVVADRGTRVGGPFASVGWPQWELVGACGMEITGVVRRDLFSFGVPVGGVTASDEECCFCRLGSGYSRISAACSTTK
jgi:hypothetical protein